MNDITDVTVPTVASKQMKTLGVDLNCFLYILMVGGTFKKEGES